MNRREYLGEWKVPTEAFLRAVELWRAYDRETDAFDLAHGARVNERGEVGPAELWARGRSALFARRAKERAEFDRTAHGIDDKTWHDAASSAARHEPPAASPDAGDRGSRP